MLLILRSELFICDFSTKVIVQELKTFKPRNTTISFKLLIKIMGTVVNQTFPYLKGGSLKMTLNLPLTNLLKHG